MLRAPGRCLVPLASLREGAPPWMSRADLRQGRLMEISSEVLSPEDMNEIEKPIQSTEARETIIPQEQAAQAAARAPGNAELNLPDGALILLPTRNVVLFPGIVAPLTLGRQQSIAGAQAAAKADKPVGIIL